MAEVLGVLFPYLTCLPQNGSTISPRQGHKVLSSFPRSVCVVRGRRPRTDMSNPYLAFLRNPTLVTLGHIG